MSFTAKSILTALDRCCNDFTFPMLDNGYVYLAATRMALYRGEDTWSIVIEIFGFSPREGDPSNYIHTFSNHLVNRRKPENYVSREAFEAYLRNNPHFESSPFSRLELGDSVDEDFPESLMPSAKFVTLRGEKIPLPEPKQYAKHDIELQDPPQVQIFELCRYLAGEHREAVLATEQERRIHVPPEMKELLVLDEWNHPDVVHDSERPSGSETFQQLAKVLVENNPKLYRPTLPPNTHWKHWPDGVTL